MTKEDMEMIALITAQAVGQTLTALGLVREKPVVRSFSDEERALALEAVKERFPVEAGFAEHRILGDNIEYEDRPLAGNKTGQLVIVPVGLILDRWIEPADTKGPTRPQNGNGGKKANAA